MEFCNRCGEQWEHHGSACITLPQPTQEVTPDQRINHRIDRLFGIVAHLTDRVVELERNEAARESYILEQNERL